VKKIINSKSSKLSKSVKQNAIRFHQEGLKLCLFGDKNSAVKSFKQSINLDKDYADPYFQLGNIYIQSEEFDLSEAMLETAIKLNNQNPDFYYNLAITKYILNKTEEAILNYRESLKLDPNNSKALKFLGNCYKDIKNFNEALKIYNSWHTLEPENPEPTFNKSLLHIRNGRFDVGWNLYEVGLKNNIREPLNGFYHETKKYWNGIPFDGTLLVYGEQGLGDQIVFGTILPELLKDQPNVIVKVNKKLRSLFKDSYPKITVYSENDLIDGNLYQKYISMGSLCKFYRKHTDDFMKSEFKSYSLNQSLPKRFREQINNLNNLKIGFSWLTFADNNRQQRSLTSYDVSKILNCNDNSFINLQYGKVSGSVSEINNLSKNKLISIKGLDLTNDIDNVINVIKHCDLVVTIDNTLAHLASSLGKHVWILLPYSADFRWMENVTATLWYENALLLRQSKIGNWNNVIETIKQAFSQS